MVTINTSTVGGTSPDYTTLALWEAAVQGNFVTADKIERAACRAVTLSGAVTLGGSTTDSTRYYHIDADTGAETDGIVGGSGCLISGTVTIQNDVLLSQLRFSGTIPLQLYTSSPMNVTARRCLFHDASSVFNIDDGSVGLAARFENCGFVDTAFNQIYHSGGHAALAYTFYHCSAYNTNVTFNCYGTTGVTLTTYGTLWHGSWSQFGTETPTHNATDSIYSFSKRSYTSTDTNNTWSATFTTSTGASAVILTSLTASAQDLHLVDHANQLAYNYATNLTGTIDELDIDQETRPTSGSWEAGYDTIDVATSGITGTFANTIGGVTANFDGVVLHPGAFTGQVGGVTADFNGIVLHPGAFTGQVGGVTAAFSGTVKHFGTFAGQVGGVTAAFSGTVGAVKTGTFANTIGGVTAAFAGTVTHPGSFANTIGGVTAAFAGTVTHPGSFTGQVGAITSAFTGKVTHFGTFAGQVGGVTAAFSGTVLPAGAITGTFSNIIGAVTSAFVGTVTSVGYQPPSVPPATTQQRDPISPFRARPPKFLGKLRGVRKPWL